MSRRPPPPPEPHPAGRPGTSPSTAAHGAAGDPLTGLQQAIVRPDLRGRTHPDPRADPPTVAFDPASARTEELAHVAADDTARIPVVTPAAHAQPAPSPATGVRGLDGRAFAATAVIGAVAGAVSWLVAARLVPPVALGEAQLVVSALLLVGGAAQLGVGAGLQRWLRDAGRSAARLVRRAVLIVVTVSALGAAAYGLATAVPGPIGDGAGDSPVLWLLVFAFGAAAWAAVRVHGAVLVAVGGPWWAGWHGGLFGLARIGALVVLVGVTGLGAEGVVLSFLGPVVVWAVVGFALAAVLARRSGLRVHGGALPGRAEVLALLPPIALAQLVAALLHHQVPILVNLRFGPETGAVFFIAWQAVLVVDLAAAWAGHRLAVRVGREPHRATEIVSRARRRALLVALPPLALAAALATPLSSALGAAYSSADDVLRLLLLGLASRLVVAHLDGARQVAGPVPGAGGIQLCGTVLVLAVTIAVPVAAGGEAMMVLVAGGYAAAQLASVIATLALPAGRRADVEVGSP